MRDAAICIKVLNSLIQRELDERCKLMAGDMISGVNGLIMGYILRRGGNVYQRELEDEFGLTRSTISKVVNLMERKGLIERAAAEHDARQRVIILTDAAREMARGLQEEGRRISERLLSGFDEGETDVLAGFIDRMMQNMRREDD